MKRITRVVAVGSMALIGVAGSASTALATTGGDSGPGQNVSPARVARCLAAHGGQVSRTAGGGYQIVIPSSRVKEATTACRRYLPSKPGQPKVGGKHGSKLVIRIEGKTVHPGGSQAPGDPAKAKKYLDCLDDNGAPGVVKSADGTKIVGEATVIAGTEGAADSVVKEDGSTAAKAPGDPKLVKALQACASLAPDDGPVLQSSAG
jgi:hypothetical protein